MEWSQDDMIDFAMEQDAEVEEEKRRQNSTDYGFYGDEEYEFYGREDLYSSDKEISKGADSIYPLRKKTTTNEISKFNLRTGSKLNGNESTVVNEEDIFSGELIGDDFFDSKTEVGLNCHSKNEDKTFSVDEEEDDTWYDNREDRYEYKDENLIKGKNSSYTSINKSNGSFKRSSDFQPAPFVVKRLKRMQLLKASRYESGNGNGDTSRLKVDQSKTNAKIKRQLQKNAITLMMQNACNFIIPNQLDNSLITGQALNPLPLGPSSKFRHLTRPPDTTESVTCIAKRGGLIYFPRKTKGELQKELRETSFICSRSRHLLCDEKEDLQPKSGKVGGLLQVPMDTLLKRVEKLRRERYKNQGESNSTSMVDYNESEITMRRSMYDASDEMGVDIEKQESNGEESAMLNGDNHDKNSNKESKAKSSLWVNKYAPVTFFELLSEEAINREVLRALHGWDEYVFKKDPKRNRKNKSYQDNNKNTLFHKNGNTHNTVNESTSNNDITNLNVDGEDATNEVLKDRRPEKRCILLCGAPGTGKTTLAHILSKQCGYRPLEVNASDDRSAPVLKQFLINAMESQSVSQLLNHSASADAGKPLQQVPNCIILDEVDGIEGKHAIQMLIDAIKAPLSTNNRKKKAGGKKKDFTLTRPLICICNDLYSPNIRGLRDVSLVFRLNRTSPIRLMQRLKYICAVEGLPIPATLLTPLCENSGYDVRSCINTLQLISHQHNRNKKNNPKQDDKNSNSNGDKKMKNDLNSDVITGKQVAEIFARSFKDRGKDIKTIWNCIFKGKEAKNSTFSSSTTLSRMNDYDDDDKIIQDHRNNNNSSTSNKREKNQPEKKSAFSRTLRKKTSIAMESVIEDALSLNDIQSIVNGLYENMLNANFSDSNMLKLSAANEWLVYYDLINTKLFTNSFLGEELGMCSIGGFFLLCQNNHKHASKLNLSIPVRDNQFRVYSNRMNAIVEAFQEEKMRASIAAAIWTRKYASSSEQQYSVAQLYTKKDLVMELIPSLLPIVDPTYCTNPIKKKRKGQDIDDHNYNSHNDNNNNTRKRFVPYDLMTDKEREKMARVIAMMAANGLSFSILNSIQEGRTEPQNMFKLYQYGKEENEKYFALEPPIHELTRYEKKSFSTFNSTMKENLMTKFGGTSHLSEPFNTYNNKVKIPDHVYEHLKKEVNFQSMRAKEVLSDEEARQEGEAETGEEQGQFELPGQDMGAQDEGENENRDKSNTTKDKEKKNETGSKSRVFGAKNVETTPRFKTAKPTVGGFQRKVTFDPKAYYHRKQKEKAMKKEKEERERKEKEN